MINMHKFSSHHTYEENLMSINKSTPLVYVVDDEFAVRDSLTLLIETAGIKTRNFQSAEDFLSNYNSKQPGCLVLDVMMPSMSGYELQNELLDRNIHIPIILISGTNVKIPASAEALRANAIAFLKKPFNTELLLEQIKAAIKKDTTFRDGLIKKCHIQDRISLNHLNAEKMRSY